MSIVNITLKSTVYFHNQLYKTNSKNSSNSQKCKDERVSYLFSLF